MISGGAGETEQKDPFRRNQILGISSLIIMREWGWAEVVTMMTMMMMAF